MSQLGRVRVRGAGLSLLSGDVDYFLVIFMCKLSVEGGVVESSDVASFFCPVRLITLAYPNGSYLL
jgi:hypothetical protein